MSWALCIYAASGMLAVVVPTSSFSLSWLHSVEHVLWQEHYVIADGRLWLTAAEVKGSGAGMEPHDDAQRSAGGWFYRPEPTPRESLTLATSPYAGDYWICWPEECARLGQWVSAETTHSVTLSGCAR